MANWICNNLKCPFKIKNSKPYTETTASIPKKPATGPKCKHCKLEMSEDKSVVLVEVSPFEKWAGEVKIGVGANYATSYQKNVIDFLEKGDAKRFQADFVADMKKETDRNKFAKNSPPRSVSPSTVCFDNALKMAGFELPQQCPKGEKFDFEIPYILAAIQWKEMAFCKSSAIFSQKFSTFLQNVKGGHSYMLATRGKASDLIGHMIFVYVNKDKTQGWIHDPQQLQQHYNDYVCVAWESPIECGREQKPGCTLDLIKGLSGKFVS